ncbi:MAG: hypothetical protein AB7F20_14510 [Geoalkalibacter sp.]|uniref:hypothetical protein n=1 Tax=Geoalkalibacter sp. TaxID=3041440 RepID=UPI003D09C57C
MSVVRRRLPVRAARRQATGGPLPLEPMTMLVFRHESLMEFSRESFTFIAQGKREKM